MLNSKPLKNIIFLDLESIPALLSFFDMTRKKQELFRMKFHKEWKDHGLDMDLDLVEIEKQILEGDIHTKDTIEECYYNRAALHVEFNKIVTISIGWFASDIPLDLAQLPVDKELEFKTKSFYGKDEKKLLLDFYNSMKSVLDKHVGHTHHIAAFNGAIFDMPVIAKRFILNGLPLPPFFDVSDLKPWERGHWVDPKATWQFGVFDGNASLDLLCECFGIASSKDLMSGKDVGKIYYEEGGLEKIKVYCEFDVLNLATLYLRMKGIQNKVVNV